MLSSVLMLCNRSANFIKITLISSTRVNNIFLKFSDCIDDPGVKTPDILVNPSQILATLCPKFFSINFIVKSVSSTTSCNKAAIIDVAPNPIS